jgi:hypothetical protein
VRHARGKLISLPQSARPRSTVTLLARADEVIDAGNTDRELGEVWRVVRVTAFGHRGSL